MRPNDWEGFSKADLARLASLRAIERGLFDQRRGNLVKAFKLGRTLAGIVAGQWGCYRVCLRLEGEKIRGACTCTEAGFCRHQVLLAVGWLEQRSRFLHLEPDLKRLAGNRGKEFEVLCRMAEADLVNFWEVIHNQTLAVDQFIHSRDLLNRVRNLVQYPVLTKAEAERFGGRLNRALNWLKEVLPAGDMAGLEALGLLVEGVVRGYQSWQDQWFCGYFAEVLQLCRGIPAIYPEAAWAGLFTRLWTAYQNPALWEAAPEIRPALVGFMRYSPQTCRPTIAAFLTRASSLPVLSLISLYELWLTVPVLIGCYPEQYKLNEDFLLRHSEGRLWLLDRWIEIGDPRARKGIVASIKQADPGAKSGPRELLIRLNLAESQPERAAALCYAQFVEEPNFEEYLRIKQLLAPSNPVKWRKYYLQMQRLAERLGQFELGLRMAGDFPDLDFMVASRGSIEQDRRLLELLAAILVRTASSDLVPCYDWTCIALLESGTPRDWHWGRYVMEAYQKWCNREGRIAQWRDFEAHVVEQYGNKPGFQARLGGLFDPTVSKSKD